MTLHNELICGTQGWEDPAWNADYFPEECPEEWRLAYYSNDFRGVWLSASFWNQTEVMLDQLLEEAEEEDDFWLVVTLPADWISRPSELLKTLVPIASQVACLVAPIANELEKPVLEEAATRLGARHPLAFDLSHSHPDYGYISQLTKQHSWSLVWHSENAQPNQSGQFLPIVTAETDLRQMRTIFEKVANWMSESRNAGLFFRPVKQAPNLARQARELSELMGL